MLKPDQAKKYNITQTTTGGYDIELADWRRLVADYPTKLAAAEALGIDRHWVGRQAKKFGVGWPTDRTPGDRRAGAMSGQDEMSVVGDVATITRIVPERITTLDQLCKHAEIDLRVWDIERWSCNKWEVAAYNREDKSFAVQDLWQVKATLRKSKDKADLLALLDEVLTTIGNKAVKVKKHPHKDGEYLCEIDLFDVHLGKLTWGKETGQNYDIKIARQTIAEAVSQMVERIKPYPIDRFLIPVGQDYFNSNSSEQATAKGTPQDEDDRWKKTFRVGWMVLTEVVARLEKIAPIDILVITGNHDEDSSFYLGEVLCAYYRNNANVRVNNDPPLRKYYLWGKNLIGFTHGSEEKIKDLPSIMATENPSGFASARYREWHLGHQHRKKEYNWISIEEHNGVTVRMLRSLTATDEWHHRKGYVGNVRAAEAFIWAKAGGVVAQLSVIV